MPNKKSKRGQGRPADGGVGRETIIENARRALRELPPARVTVSLVAREAGVDPALVRYYFKDRTNLLMAVVDDLLKELPQRPEVTGDPADFIRTRVQETHKFSRAAKHMQRLMLDELVDAKSDEVRERLRHLNLRAVAVYKELLDKDADGLLKDYDPLFLYFVIIGIFDFFVSAESLLKSLLPADADMEKVSKDYTSFVSDLILNGILAKPDRDAD